MTEPMEQEVNSDCSEQANHDPRLLDLWSKKKSALMTLNKPMMTLSWQPEAKIFTSIGIGNTTNKIPEEIGITSASLIKEISLPVGCFWSNNVPVCCVRQDSIVARYIAWTTQFLFTTPSLVDGEELFHPQNGGSNQQDRNSPCVSSIMGLRGDS
jgi:hypothetical protein